MLNVKIQFFKQSGQMPHKATLGSAGWDVYATKDGYVEPGGVGQLFLGFALELPPGWQAKVKQRGSMFAKGLITNDSPIDSDFRGEVFALVANTGKFTWFYKRGDRIGQLLFEPVPVVRFIRAEQLTDTMRGAGSLGSTGE